MMRGVGQTLLCCASLFISTGCVPIVAHAPHVESGTHFTLAGGLSTDPVREASDSLKRSGPPTTTFVVRGSYGMRSTRDADGAAVELGAELISLTGFAVDAYVQAPPRWTGATDFGFGAAAVAGAFAGPLVYLQAGRKVSDSYYLFTTQGVGRFTRRSNLRQGTNGPAISWQPTIAIEPLQAWSRVHYFFVSATVGRMFNGCVQVFLGCNESTRASVAVGVAMSRSLNQRR